jgi:hypothetical protein
VTPGQLADMALFFLLIVGVGANLYANTKLDRHKKRQDDMIRQNQRILLALARTWGKPTEVVCAALQDALQPEVKTKSGLWRRVKKEL